MSKIKITCPRCGKPCQCDDSHRGEKVKCPHCKQIVLVPHAPAITESFFTRRRTKRKFLLIACALVLTAFWVIGSLIVHPVRVRWPDRRPVGALFLASNFYSSATNPRGWFNDPKLDVTGPDGPQRFRKALLDYTDRSIAILKRTGAQGAIVWDLEGEEYPHKTTYIGDPRMLGRLAPEMEPVADEFFGRLRSAGLRVGLTVRPQQLVFDDHGQPRQMEVLNTRKILLQKIDYARERWGATMFYLDSNGGIRRPDEVWQLRSLASERPDILLIPEHHYLPYSAFSAPYIALCKGESAGPSGLARNFFPEAFKILDISDANQSWDMIAAARSRGDVVLFRAWFWSPECQLLEGFAPAQQ